MIKIYPTTASGLSAATYKMELPGFIMPMQARPERVRTVLSGKALVARWQKRQDGARETKTFNLKQEDFDKLLAIVEHETAFDWVAVSAGRRYLCTIDITEAEKAPAGSIIDWRVSVGFTIIERLQ
jgi:hypothetical protein